MTPSLPASFLGAPIAHRGYHDNSEGRPENSRAAIEAAIAAGYAVEIDLQMTADARAVVFHDYGLKRLTGRDGVIRQLTRNDARSVQLLHGYGAGIPDLAEVLELVNGRAPLLIEIKDQDGHMGKDVGPLEAAAAALLVGYRGDVAVMSFNPNSVEQMAQLAPEIPRGLVTSSYSYDEWPLPQEVCDRLRAIPDVDRVGASFISHEVEDLNRSRVRDLKQAGLPVLCWTVKSAAQEKEARKVAENITFEGYAAAVLA
ncbi:glycerophosphodiester phosphodiesterase family protein [Primorskyibacter sp. S87]|uniref:glycerophosphodiester phosphodiesterase family protein n=1 Tax=Primorskyibacter sp. S87 TaxID=3415126 RepID=UPI003C7AE3CD